MVVVVVGVVVVGVVVVGAGVVVVVVVGCVVVVGAVVLVGAVVVGSGGVVVGGGGGGTGVVVGGIGDVSGGDVATVTLVDGGAGALGGVVSTWFVSWLLTVTVRSPATSTAAPAPIRVSTRAVRLYQGNPTDPPELSPSGPTGCPNSSAPGSPAYSPVMSGPV